MLPNEITLHVGLQKTGTTLIQRSLRRLRPQLAAAGVAYLDRAAVTALPALEGWRAFRRPADPVPELEPNMPAYVLGRSELEQDFTEQLRQLAVTLCEDAARESGRAPTHLLMSNESLVGTQASDFGPVYRPRAVPALEHVLDSLTPQRVNLVLYVRRQDRLIESQYMQRIHAGEVHDFADWARRATAETFIDFPGLVERLRRIDRVEEVRVRPFEIVGTGARHFVADLLHPLGLELDLSQAIRQWANPSYTAPALEAALVLNPLLDNVEQLRTVRKFLRKTFPARRYPAPTLFREGERERLLAMYDTSNRMLFRTYCAGVREDAYATEDATASLATLS